MELSTEAEEIYMSNIKEFIYKVGNRRDKDNIEAGYNKSTTNTGMHEGATVKKNWWKNKTPL